MFAVRIPLPFAMSLANREVDSESGVSPSSAIRRVIFEIAKCEIDFLV
jgi:hypothetical protein